MQGDRGETFALIRDSMDAGKVVLTKCGRATPAGVRRVYEVSTDAARCWHRKWQSGLVPCLLARQPVLWSARLQTPRRRNRAVADWSWCEEPCQKHREVWRGDRQTWRVKQRA